MIYKMELSDSVDTMVFDLLEVPIVDKDITGIAENTTIDGNVFNDYLWLKKQYVQKWSIMCQDEYDRLRGFWTRQFGNAEVPFYRLFYGSNVYEDKNFLTADGFTQILNPTERPAPLSLTHLYGNAEQKTLSGKNLLNVPNGTTSRNNIELIANDGTIRVHNTGTTSCAAFGIDGALRSTNYGSYVPWNNMKLNAGTYTISTTYISGSTTTTGASGNFLRLQVSSRPVGDTGLFSTAEAAAEIKNTNMSVTFTLSEQKEIIVIVYEYSSNATIDITFKAQLESGSTATDWQEFVGGIPSPNPDYPQEIKTVTGAQTVKITGKNLFDKNAITSGYLVSRGIGTLSQNALYGATDFIPVRVGQQLHFGDDFNRWYSAYYDANKVAVGEPTNTANITIPDGVAYLRTSLLLTNLDTAQLELGSQASDYEPYQAQSYEINLGKNLIPFTNQDFTVNGVRYYVQNGALYLDGTCTSETLTNHQQFKDNFAFTLEAGTYTFSMGTGGTLRPMSVKKYSNDSNISSLSSIQMQTTFTLTEQTQVYIGFYMVSGNSYSNTKYEVQIERGPAKTDFTPYKTPIELAKIPNTDYEDKPVKVNGTWYVRRMVGKVVLTGDASESWAYVSGAHARFQYSNSTIALEPSPSAIGAVMSDHFTASSTNDVYNGVDGKIGVHATIHQFWFSYLAITDLNAFKTWLSTHNTTVYYALATPTDEEITDSELIAQLNHIYELYQGQNNLWLIPNAGAQGEIDGTYRLIYDEETDIIPKTPVVLTLTDGGVINPCGCRQNIQLIMRETEGE